MARRLVFLAALICLVHGQGSQGGAPSRKNAPTSGSDDSNMPTSGSDGSSSVSSDCDICGTTTTYVEEIVNDDDLGENSVRSISGNGCPNHYSVCTGKDGITGCGGTGEEGTDTEASDQDFAYTLPAYPVLRDDDPYDIE